MLPKNPPQAPAAPQLKIVWQDSTRYKDWWQVWSVNFLCVFLSALGIE